ncbi:MAG: lysine--tRNA ligase [Nanoarchaeota archaeon]|nr:lysine--tRNA ligase [Nanoarchaeota archaeon]|tara:strand:- start:1682 stop:3220 length:1539 start_codon:yes stop_codon:yes gene_type:complete
MNKKEQFHWADQVADKVIQEKGDKDSYTVAAGITPSGTIHIGNFREIITTDLVAKALEKKGKKVRFIYSWDDYDRFRKVPKNVDQDFEKYIGMSISEVPDPWKCHKSYAEHFEKEMEESLPNVNIKPEFIRQSEMYKACKYAEGIKEALNNKDKIIEILNKYRKEHLLDDWYPVNIYCSECKKDFTKVRSYDGEYGIDYECKCGHKETLDFRKQGNINLKWRSDWPMRWNYEKIDFEPGGKDHSAAGGSYQTGKEIIETIWNKDAPSYAIYEWIGLKGGGQFASSKGVVVTLKEVLEVYEPEIVRFLFAGTRPNTEFAISFDADVLKIYSDYDKLEKIYFGKEPCSDEKLSKQKRIYELSSIKIPKEIPFHPSFRHLTMLVQIFQGDIEKVLEYYEKDKKTELRANLAWNWIQKHAPEEFKFTLQEKSQVELDEKEKSSLRLLIGKLKQKDYDEETLFEEFYSICQESNINNTDFFKAAYLVLINKERGPRLASFILAVGKEKIIEILETIK